VLGWPTTYNLSNTDAVTTVQCVDGNRIFANTVLAQSSYISEVLDPTYVFFSSKPRHYWPLQTNDYVQYDEVGDLPVEFWNPFSNNSLSLNVLDRPIDAPNSVNTAGMINETADVNWPIQGVSTYFDTSDGFAGKIVVHKNSSNYLAVSPNVSANEISVAYYNSDGNKYLTPDSGSIWKDVSFSNWRELTNRVDCFIDTSGNLNLRVNSVSVAVWSLTTGTASGATGYDPIIIEGAQSHVAIYGDESPLNSSGSYWLNEIGASSLDGQNAIYRLAHIGTRAGWPDAWYYFPAGTGVQTLGAYLPKGRRATDYLDTINNAEQGALFFNRENKIELIDRDRTNVSIPQQFFSTEAGDLPFQDVTVDGNSADAVTNKVIARFATGERTATNQTSVDDYGLSSLVIDAELISDPIQAQQIAQRRVDLASTPRTRLTQLKVDVRKDSSTLVDAMASMELADDVVVFFTPTNVGDDIWRSVRVQGISHDITPESWTSSLYLAPGTTGQNGPLFILNDSRWGELNDGNKLG